MSPELDDAVTSAKAASAKAMTVLQDALAVRPRVAGLVPTAREALSVAEALERAAYDARSEANLDGPGVRALIAVLKTINAELRQTTADLKETLEDLQAFVRVVKGATSILKAIKG